MGMPSTLQPPERFDGGLGLRLGDTTPRPKARLALDQRAAPELPAILPLFVAPFCPLLAT